MEAKAKATIAAKRQKAEAKEAEEAEAEEAKEAQAEAEALKVVEKDNKKKMLRTRISRRKL